MSRIRFTDSAQNDLLELWLNIAEENQVAADKSLDVIQEAVSLLAAQPKMGMARPELADGLRSIPTRTPYIIFYVPNEEGLTVVRVLHHARDIDIEYFPWATAMRRRAIRCAQPHAVNQGAMNRTPTIRCGLRGDRASS